MLRYLAERAMMTGIVTKPARFFVKKNIKKTTPESFVKTTPIQKEHKITDFEIKLEVFDKKNYVRGLGEEEKPIPVSPKLGPIRVENPKISDKTYRWCACGLSREQPFCDGSHAGTKFYPVRFTVEEESKAIDLCGCKLTTQAPYCDGISCLKAKEIIHNQKNQDIKVEDSGSKVREESK